ncbi:hypothetical protein N0V82_008637 [Gnomoniopsis sp. IMI 355080]|nr:hypothetical protein N0V82_008637 [Gnomoniopsis sp. IMI 355080]
MTSTALVLPPRDMELSRNFIYASRFQEQAHQQWESDAKIWVVKASEKVRRAEGRSWSVWIEPEFYESKRQYKSPVLGWIEGFENRRRSGGFCEGRPMVDFCIQVPLCVGHNLPRKLYRVVHDEHPSGGTRARGYERVHVNPITFQVHFQRHLKWSCRDLSPLMSATSSLGKARRIAAMYKHMGFTGIEMLYINTNGADWEGTFVFDVQRLLECFKLPILSRNSFLEEEYLIQDEIPPSRVVRASLYNIRSQCSAYSWQTAWDDAEKLVRRNAYQKRKYEVEDAELPPKKRQIRTHKFRKVRN